MLHGLGSTPERVMTAFLGSDAADPRPTIDGFVLAPHGHGDAFYRGPGETDVLETIDWVVRNYPIDETRISITGHSMGGTGAAHFALRYSDRFTGVAALAGYQSYFVRGDVVGRPLRTWERTELSRWSPASFAENGRDSFLFVAQGTQDLPLINSRSLSERLRALGFPVEEAWPDIGHDVWQVVWDGGKFWSKLSARQLDRNPARVVLKTDSLRFGTRRWVSITALDRYDTPASIDARVTTPTRVEVRTAGARAFALSRTAPGLKKDEPIVVDADNQPLEFGKGDALAAHRNGTTWVRGAMPSPSGLVKQAGLEGPIRDAFTDALAFVYGTLDPRQARAAREVAEHFRRRWAGNAALPSSPTSRFRATCCALIRCSWWVRRTRIGSCARSTLGSRSAWSATPFAPVERIFPETTSSDSWRSIRTPINPTATSWLWRRRTPEDSSARCRSPHSCPTSSFSTRPCLRPRDNRFSGRPRVLGAGYFDRSWSLPASFADAVAPAPAKTAWTGVGAVFAEARRSPAAAETVPRRSGTGVLPDGAPRP